MAQLNNYYKLTRNDTQKASAVLAAAFIEYPTFRYLFPDVHDREKKLRRVMRFFLECGLIHGTVIAPSGNIEGVCIWYKSGDPDFRFGSLLKAGLIGLWLNLNASSFGRFKKLGDAKKSNRKTLLEGEYYLLDVIGVDPSLAGRGHAKLMIEAMLEQVDKENMRCFLETSNVRNVDYYRRYGFELLRGYSHDGLESFCLLRK